uniref:Uncharacterized protein n=1 Tax=Ditylenchus dipsaci TaxID=166011 RepID=A0A915D8V8_9BILA
MDTDIDHKYKTAEHPLVIGKTFGELTDEYPDHTIVEVVSACKQYAMADRYWLDPEDSRSVGSRDHQQQQQQQPTLLHYNQIRGDKFGNLYTMHTPRPTAQ